MNKFSTGILLVTALFFYYFSNGQDKDNDLLLFKCDSNFFINAKESIGYDSLFKKFNRLQISGNEQIRILQVGDSHIQADLLTCEIRRNFAKTFFNLTEPPAIAFPYGILKSNNPYAVSVICNGNWTGYSVAQKSQFSSLLGLTACSHDTCLSKIMIHVRTQEDSNASFSKLLVFCNDDSSHIALNTVIPSIHRIHIFNDSIFCHEFIYNCYTDSTTLFFKVFSDTFEFKLYGIIPFNDDPGIMYHTLGINGAKASLFNNTLLPSFIKYMHYDWVILSLGTNDCYLPAFDSISVSQSFQTLLASIRQDNPNIAILLTTPMSHYRKKNIINSNVISMKNIMLDIVTKNHAAVWDFYTVSGGETGMSQWNLGHLSAPDKLHLNTHGYQLQGDLFFDAFLNTYMENISKP